MDRMPVAAAHLGRSVKGCAHVLAAPHPPGFREVHDVWMPDVLLGEDVLGGRVVWAADELVFNISAVAEDFFLQGVVVSVVREDAMGDATGHAALVGQPVIGEQARVVVPVSLNPVVPSEQVRLVT